MVTWINIIFSDKRLVKENGSLPTIEFVEGKQTPPGLLDEFVCGHVNCTSWDIHSVAAIPGFVATLVVSGVEACVDGFKLIGKEESLYPLNRIPDLTQIKI